jgi:hypothetical protein
MRAYTPMKYNVVALICQDPNYKRMTFDDVFGRIINHVMHIEEALWSSSRQSRMELK